MNDELREELDDKANEISFRLLTHNEATETQYQLIRDILGIIFEDVADTNQA